MRSHTLSLTLLDDCVFSASAATTGGHASLDRIPGSALLGAAAAQLYPELSAQDADLLFQSGRVRFHDGLPCDAQGRLGWPVPLSLFAPKVDGAGDAKLDATRVLNYLHADPQTDGEDEDPPNPEGRKKQYKGLRGFHLTSDGRRLGLQRLTRLKTAIDAATGRAAEAQLFGYEALTRGQRFVATVEADDDVPEPLFARLAAVLHGPLLLGRSRSAEYGRAQAHPVALPQSPHPAQNPWRAGEPLVLWLLADFAPCDADGNPTLDIQPEALGLPAGTTVVWRQTFLRTRRYSPWNAHRHGYDQERLVYIAGGVLTLQLPAHADAAAVQSTLARGLGLHRAAGLGRVAVCPQLLAGKHPIWVEAQAIAPPPAAAAMPSSHALLDWLQRRAGVDQDRQRIERCAKAIVRAYAQRLQAARRALGLPEYATDFYPSASQWGSVLEAAKRHADDPALLWTELFQPERGIIRDKADSGWDLQLPPLPGSRAPEWQKLCAWLRSVFEQPAAALQEPAATDDRPQSGQAAASTAPPCPAIAHGQRPRLVQAVARLLISAPDGNLPHASTTR